MAAADSRRRCVAAGLAAAFTALCAFAVPASAADGRECGRFADRAEDSRTEYTITVTAYGGVRCRTALGIARDLRFGRGVDVRGEDNIHLERWPGWRCGEGAGGGNCRKGKRSVGWQVGPPLPSRKTRGSHREPPRFPPMLYNGDIDLRMWENSTTLPPQIRPPYIKFGSGSGWTIKRWKRWGGRVAEAQGTYHDHQEFETTGTVRLTKPRRCGRYRLYTVLTARYDSRHPGGYWPPRRISLARSCY